MGGCFLGGLADDRQVQATADHPSDLSERYAFVSDRVIPSALRPLFDREPVETRRIEPVHAGPAVAPIADIGRHALFARDADESRNEAVITVAVDGWRQAHGRRPHAT